MASTKVALANLALKKLGARAISSFNEDSAEARAVSVVYDDVRDFVLSEHPWSFAQKRWSLNEIEVDLPMDSDGMAYVYAKPSDFIELVAISDPAATVKVESHGILSDTASLKIIYTYRCDDPTKYFPQFTYAFSLRLAYELSYVITESRTKTSDLINEYEKVALPKAKSKDSQQSTPMQPIQDEWENARAAGGVVISQPGAQTWHYL